MRYIFILVFFLITYHLSLITSIYAQSAYSQWVTAVGDPKGPPPGGLLSIVQWDERIVSHLTVGAVFTNYLNRLTPARLEVNSTGYATREWIATTRDNLYWCTKSVIDAYNLAGFTGLTHGAHDGVLNMRIWWRTGQGHSLGYTYLEYNFRDSTEQKKAILNQVQPGFSIMWMQVRDEYKDNEHVAIVKEIIKDPDTGNGSIEYIQSNAPSPQRTGKVQFQNWHIARDSREVVGFGGPPNSGGAGAPPGNPSQPGNTDINAILAKLPGNSSATVVLPNGQTTDKAGSTSKPSYSAIKVFIAAAAFKAQADGSLDLSENYTIKASDIIGGTGNLTSADVNKTYTYRQILEFMLEYSDNSSSNILIRALGGFSPVNQFAQSNGYSQTFMRRFFIIQTTPENLTSSNDLVKFYQDLFAKKFAGADDIIAILQQRRQKEQPGYIYLGKLLPASANLVEKSGNNDTGIRNDGGSFTTKSGQRVYIAVMLSGLTNNAEGENAIGKTAFDIYNSLP